MLAVVSSARAQGTSAVARYGSSIDEPTQTAQTTQTEQDPRTYAIIGAAIEVRKRLGWGYLESVYQNCLAFEFEARGIPFERERRLDVVYKGRHAGTFRPDFLCFEDVIVEVKVQRHLTDADGKQVVHYLKAANKRTGLLLHFGPDRLVFLRYVFDEDWRYERSVGSE